MTVETIEFTSVIDLTGMNIQPLQPGEYLHYEDIAAVHWADAEHQRINCMVKFEKYDRYIPYTVVEFDDMEHTRDMWSDIIEGEFGPIGDYVPAAKIAYDVNFERDRRIENGVTVNVTGLGAVPLQGRPQDQVNLLGLKDTAKELAAAGITAPIIPFRDALNVTHILTPAQLIEMVDKGKMWVSAMMQASWDIKAMDPIPQDFAADSYWPLA